MRQRLRIGEVVHRNEVEIGDALDLRRANDLTTNASKAVDTNPCCHSVSSVRLKPIPTRMSSAECHVTDYPGTRLVEHLRAGIESRGCSDHVVDQNDVSAAHFLDLLLAGAERARNVVQPFLGCQLRLRRSLA